MLTPERELSARELEDADTGIGSLEEMRKVVSLSVSSTLTTRKAPPLERLRFAAGAGTSNGDGLLCMRVEAALVEPMSGGFSEGEADT